MADASGVARFQTVWPGWYRGRTPHVHYKVFLDTTTVLTSQLFFPDGASELVFRADPYRGRAARQDTDNATDGIARRAGAAAFARVAQAGTGWRAELVVGVDPR
jgi:protocatechuate 3,4-dioxygenase beta subunit